MSLFSRRAPSPRQEVHIGGKKVTVDLRQAIGKGGEADVIDIGGGRALKRWKAPDHPDLAGDPEGMEAARLRILEHQTKMRRFPTELPVRVAAPLDLATDPTGTFVVGYTMAIVTNAAPIAAWADPGSRAAQGPWDAIGPLLSDLAGTLEALHARGVTIGDLNDMNILCRGAEAHVIDADSFGFGEFPCRVFTERFLDPRLSPAALAGAEPRGPSADWYAFGVLAMQTLLAVGPYGGVYKPKSPGNRVAHGERPKHRITVFHPEVVYPKAAVPWIALPDDILHALVRTFEKDDRRPLPKQALSALTWTACGACGLPHARRACPRCVVAAPPLAAPVRGAGARRERVRRTEGEFLAIAVQEGALRFVAHEEGAYVREDGRRVLIGAADRQIRMWVCGSSTVVAKGSDVVVLREDKRERLSVDLAGDTPAIAANARDLFFVEAGTLFRAPLSDKAQGLGPARHVVGQVLAGQTRLWVGDRWGFGFYRAGGLSVAFVLSTSSGGLSENVRLPHFTGQIGGVEVFFSDARIWVVYRAKTAGKTMHVAVALRPDGTTAATAISEPFDGSWLGALGGKCGVGATLLAATDAGLARVEEQNGALVQTRLFSEIEGDLSAGAPLYAGPDGLFVASPHEIHKLSLAPEPTASRG